MELNVLAELGDGVTTTHEQPIILEGPDNPFSDEGATLTPAEAEPVRFMPVKRYSQLNMAIVSMFIQELREGGKFEGTDGQGQDGADEEPATEVSALEFSDPSDDATDCATGESVDDPAVDIGGVNVRKVGENIEVEVATVQSARKSLEEAYSMAIIVLLFGWEGLAEIHAGERRQGQTDSTGNVIPGTEDAVEVTDDAVTFTVTDGDSIPEGSLLEVKAFHAETEGGSVNCDTFMDALSLSELCGGECTREE